MVTSSHKGMINHNLSLALSKELLLNSFDGSLTDSPIVKTP
jgi:hypothetical protein